MEDWPRHKDNCVPVMVTQVEEKGRGLVAARDIKMGEEILIDKTVINFENPVGVLTSLLTPTIARSLRQQIEALTEEEEAQFYQLKSNDNIVLSSRDLKIARRENCLKELKIFRTNKVRVDRKDVLVFYLALINHSCAPIADYCLKPKESEDQEKVEEKYELRAIKDIRKGEEVTIFYLHCAFSLSLKELRQEKLKDDLGFDCKCNVCCGNNDDQDVIIKKIAKTMCCSQSASKIDTDFFDAFTSGPGKKFNYTPDEWKKFAIKSGLVLALSQELHIGKVETKLVFYHNAAFAAQMARNSVLLEKAMSAWKELVMKTGFERRMEEYKEIEELVVKWSSEFNSKKPPTKEEIDCFTD